jgi:CRP-like cAMP-binding protein
MSNVLSICRDLPEMQIAKGWTLIKEGVRVDRLFVVKTGAFDVVRQDVRITRVTEPGSFMGEISALLGSTATADVVAAEDSVVHVIDRASSAVRSQPELTFAIAQLLARRLAAVTAYLVDIKHQYADSGTHLALMDEVLGNLVAMHPARVRPGSERPDLPDY